MKLCHLVGDSLMIHLKSINIFTSIYPIGGRQSVIITIDLKTPFSKCVKYLSKGNNGDKDISDEWPLQLYQKVCTVNPRVGTIRKKNIPH